jgi:hypothetical protein
MLLQWLSEQDLRDAPQSVVIGNTVVRLEVDALEDHQPTAILHDPKTGAALPEPGKWRLASD